MITACTASKVLAKQIQGLLLKLGVVSRIGTRIKKNVPYYDIRVIGPISRAMFAREIGFITERKQGALTFAMNRGVFAGSDSIPFQSIPISNLIRSVPTAKAGNYVGLRSRLRRIFGMAAYKNENRTELTYEKLGRVVNLLDELQIHNEHADHFRDLAARRYFWDEAIER